MEKVKTTYARENGIPEATFMAWVKEEQYGMFGTIQINQQELISQKTIVKSTIFCNDNIWIERRVSDCLLKNAPNCNI